MTEPAPITDATLAAAQVLWDYLRVGAPVGTSDVIVGLGSFDERVAEHAADLVLRGVAPWLLFTGGVVQNLPALPKRWSKPEAEVFREIAIARGVPEALIVVEAQARNTGENMTRSRTVLAQQAIAVRRVLLVCKPYMERRARATARAQWPEVQVSVTSAAEPFADYLRRFPPAFLLPVLVGDLQRIAVYPSLGFQTPEIIPPEVRQAWDLLVAQGHTGRLVAPPPLPEP